jgi:hypothetical protein
MVSLNVDEMFMAMFVKDMPTQQACARNGDGTQKVPDLGGTRRVGKEFLLAWADAA